MAALIGGLFGALLMGIALPIMRPIILYIGSPELLAIAVFGISMVAVLSGNAPLRGLTFACFGMMLRMIGPDPQSGTLRWTMGTLYLWDGLPLVPLTLGIFALPELCDLAIGRMAVVQAGQTLDTKTGMLLGIKDCIDNWFLILRCSWIGSAMGAIPGIGASVIDWISYGHALKTEKDAAKTFGTGDVRGVIAAESATNAREGGALVPTVAFGVPASAGMAILLGAFLIHGLVPGPDMLTKHLDLTYSMVWSIAIANILGSGLCFAFSGQLAKIATLRYTLFMPGVLSLVYIGAFEATRIVVLSAEEDPRQVRRAIDSGAAGFIPKSSTPEVLLNALRLILGGGIYLPPMALRGLADAPESSTSSHVSHERLVEALSGRQLDVLNKAVLGKPNKVIARELGISEATVKAHLSAAFRVLGVHNRTEAVYTAARLGLRVDRI